MKNRTKLFASWIILASLFLITFSSASTGCSINRHQNYDDSSNAQNIMDTNDGVIFIAYDNNYHGAEIYSKENEDRYPVSDYRFGYSNRIGQDYYAEPILLNSRTNYPDLNSRYNSYDDNFMNWLFDGQEGRILYQDKPSYYYTYSDYMGEYQKHICYNYPPRDKFVYVKCP